MIKPLSKFCFFLLLLLAIPFAAFCQLPVPKWVDDFGGSGDSKATGMITDSQNNIYITGYFNGTVDFDPSAGVHNLTSAGDYDIYVAKYTAAGALIWAKSMGGTGLDHVNNMTVDVNGNPTIIGQYNSTTLTAGSVTLQGAGGDDIFIIHLDTNGNVLWGKSLGGSGTERGEEITADAQGNLIATAIGTSSFSIGTSTITNNSGVYNALIIKYDSSGNLLWDIDLGTQDTEVYGVGADGAGNIVVSGSYSGSVDFDPLGAHNTLNNGANTPFFAKYTSAGKLIWVKTVTGGAFGFNQSVVAIGLNNDIYITGAFSSAITFNSNTTLTPQGQDTFVAKYNSDGTFVFAKDIGGAGASSYPYQIRADATDNVYVTGYFSGTIDFDPAPATTADVSYHGQTDFFTFKLDNNGAYQWAFGGGSATCNQTLGIEMSINTLNNVVLAGSFCGTVNFNPTNCGTFNVTAQNGTSDSYLATYIQGNSAVSSQITDFNIPQEIAPATIDQVKDTILVRVAPGTNLTALVPTITVSNSGTSSPASGVAQNFTSPVVYTLNSDCPALQYSVRVIAYIAKTDTVCAGATNTVTGDAETPAPTAYNWQLFQNNAWVSAPGVTTNPNYQTSALTNTADTIAIDRLRRQITSGSVISYDSFYDVYIISSNALSGNIIAAPAVTSFCTSGDPSVITGSKPSGGNGIYTYQWQSSTDSLTYSNINNATGSSYDPPVLTATTWYRLVVNSGKCTPPSTSDTVKITISTPPATPVATPAIVSVCPGSSATFSVSSPQPGIIYNWYNSPAKTTLLFTGPSFTTGAITSDSTFYVDAESGVCVSPGVAGVQVNLNSIPGAPAVVNAALSSCSGSSVTFSISSPQGGYTYNWYSDVTGGTSLISGTSFTTPALTSTQTYYAEAENSSGCVSTTRTPAVATVNPGPDVTGQGAAICPGSTATLTASSADGNAVINWYASSSGGGILFTGSSFTTPVLSIDTNYYAEAVDNITGCISATRTAVTVSILQPLKAPVVTVASNSATSLTFEWAAVPGATGYQVSIDGGKTFTAPSSGTDGLTNTISGLATGTSVTIIVQATGAQSCQLSVDSAPVTATTSPDDLIYVPNAFTPNGDGKNDVVRVHSESIQSMSFYIYDQWGELVFTSTDIKNGWDGTYKGKKEPVGVYVYFVEATMLNGQKITKKGTITLLR